MMHDRTRQALLPGLEDEPPSECGALAAGGTPSACEEMATGAGDVSKTVGGGQRPSEPVAVFPQAPSEQLAGAAVYVIDVNSLVFQVFHAIPEMTSPRGEPVNAVFGFTRDVLRILQIRRPTHLFGAFDLEGPTFRHDLYDQYKAHRPEFPAALIPQFPMIRRMLEAFGIPILELPSFEADDILATVADQAERGGADCFLVSADKDCRQLISDRVKIYNVRKDQVYGAAELAADWGVRPEQVVDFQALVGDPVDHVPGVPSIGPKSARELLAAFGSLEGVFEHAGEIKRARQRENLLAGREQALLSRKLVRLSRDVPLDIDWDRGRVAGIDRQSAQLLFDQFGFHHFGELVAPLASDSAKASTVQSGWQSDYKTVDTPEGLSELVRELEGQAWISVDTETTSRCAALAELVGLSFAWQPGKACYVPLRAPPGERSLDAATTLAALKGVFENARIAKIGQNLKYDMVVLRFAGIELAGAAFDSMMASYLLEAGERNHGLDELARRYLNHTTIKIKELIGSGKDERRMDEVPVAQVTAYAAEDADVPLRLRPILEEKLRSQELTELFESVEMPLVSVLAELEFNGIRVDAARLRQLGVEYGQRLTELESQIFSLAGHSFNIASPKQLQQVLFQEQGLKVVARTKSGPSTDADVLEELAREHPLPKLILEYRQFAKLKSTYVDALPDLVVAKTGRVHASFHQAVAATGRLSSSDPNLQNIPVRTQSGREIRSAFLPGPEGWKFLAADYSQIELRVLAHYSGDANLCAAFAADEDVHSRVASQVCGVPREEVTGEMRRLAKTVNFGVLYGQSAFGLSKASGIEQDRASAFIDSYFAQHPGVDEFLMKTLAECRERGYVKTILGRRRAIRGIRPDLGRQRNLPERTAINTVIQGSAADLIKLAMIAIHRRLRREGLVAKMLLQIHDELIFEAPPTELAQLGALVRQEMSGVYNLAVPLKVDIRTGPNWAATEPWN